jgi:hypothetical protein
MSDNFFPANFRSCPSSAAVMNEASNFCYYISRLWHHAVCDVDVPNVLKPIQAHGLPEPASIWHSVARYFLCRLDEIRYGCSQPASFASLFMDVQGSTWLCALVGLANTKGFDEEIPHPSMCFIRRSNAAIMV